jgi:hypothetical protein
MGLLHCQGKAEPKARVLYCVLQDGGFEDHAQISASDKDLIPVFDKFINFVTKDIMNLAVEFGGAERLYDDDEIRKLVKKDAIE